MTDTSIKIYKGDDAKINAELTIKRSSIIGAVLLEQLKNAPVEIDLDEFIKEVFVKPSTQSTQERADFEKSGMDDDLMIRVVTSFGIQALSADARKRFCEKFGFSNPTAYAYSKNWWMNPNPPKEE